MRFFDEASRHDPGNVAVMAQVAGLKLNALGDVDGAEKDLRAILRLDAEHEEANFMLAELMFVREDVDGALFHVRESMRLNPRQFGSLARLCRLLHRAGRVEELGAVHGERAGRSVTGTRGRRRRTRTSPTPGSGSFRASASHSPATLTARSRRSTGAAPTRASVSTPRT